MLEKFPNYVNAITRLGAELISVDKDADPGIFDGLLLPGGGDVEPSRYRCEDQGSQPPDLERDDLEFTVLERFVKAGKPVMGICRGCQVVNVFFGGTLIQDIKSNMRHPRLEGVKEQLHPVSCMDGSVMAKLYGKECIINSSHHQAADRLGNGLVITAVAPDGIPEALEHVTLPIICTQWHPERTCFELAMDQVADGSLIIGYFLNLCAKH